MTEPRIRKSVKMMIDDGLTPFSILVAHGRMVTPDEAVLLRQYEKTLDKKDKTILNKPKNNVQV